MDYSAQVTWRNHERPINCDQQSRAGDDMAQHGAFDRAFNRYHPSSLKGGGGYVAHYDSLANRFKNDVISAVH